MTEDKREFAYGPTRLMKRSEFLALVLFLLGIGICDGVQATAQDAPATFSGDLWYRSTLTGDWA